MASSSKTHFEPIWWACSVWHENESHYWQFVGESIGHRRAPCPHPRANYADFDVYLLLNNQSSCGLFKPPLLSCDFTKIGSVMYNFVVLSCQSMNQDILGGSVSDCVGYGV